MSARLSARLLEACERLSVHVTLGAVGLSALSCEAWGVTPHTSELVALGAAVSVVYCLDHALDARGGQRAAQGGSQGGSTVSAGAHRAARHLSWAPQLKVCVAMSALVGLWAAVTIPRATLSLGVTLALSCALYLLWAHRAQGGAQRSALKKLAVSFGYPLGLSLPVLARALEGYLEGGLEGSALNPVGIRVTLSLWALTSANLLFFEVMEREERGARGGGALLLIATLLSLTPLLATLTTLNLPHEGGGAFLVMSVIGVSFTAMLLIAQRQPHTLLQGGRYRAWADALFLLSWVPIISSILSRSL